MEGRDSERRDRERSSVLVPRLALFALAFTAISLPSVYQPLLNSIYQRLYNSTFYRWSTFETVLTVFSYAIIELPYTYKFGHNPHLRLDVRGAKADSRNVAPKLPKMRRPQARMGEIAIYVAPLLFLDFIMIKKYAGVPVNDIRLSGGYAALESDISTLQHFSGPYVSSSFLLPTLHNFSLRAPLQLQRALSPAPPTSRRLVLELMVAFFIYDAVFFLSHLAFHRIAPLARVHRPHHSHAEMHPQVTNRLSIGERLSLVMLANFALNIIGSHVLTRTCFVPMFVYLLVEIHSGLDLPWGHDKVMPAGWAAGPKAHAEHHKNGGGGYAPFFRWWDLALERLENRYNG